jgi:hypothetical protein
MGLPRRRVEQAIAPSKHIVERVEPLSGPAEKLEQAAALFIEKQRAYGSNYDRLGKALSAFFPSGVTLSSPSDFTRFHVLSLMVAKLGRYAHNWPKGHADSAEDLIVYSAILASLNEASDGPAPQDGTQP